MSGSPSDASSLLQWSGELTRPRLRAAVARLAPALARPTAYHFGWTDATGRPTGGHGGKGIRAALALISAEAAGACAETGLPGAVATELIHGSSLLHDDVMDHDTERRHRPTVWAVFGVGSAIVVGDALLVLAQQVLAEVPGATRQLATARLLEATGRMIDGQAEDLALESDWEVPLDRCLTMVAGKTGALLACAATIGAELAGASPATLEALDRFGHHLGLAFQAVDDILGIWGGSVVTGKSASGDLRRRKKTIPIVAALSADEPASEELRDLLRSGRLDEHGVRRAARLVDTLGGRAVAGRLARDHVEMALSALDEAEMDRVAATKLAVLARFVRERAG